MLKTSTNISLKKENTLAFSCYEIDGIIIISLVKKFIKHFNDKKIDLQ